MLAAILLGRAGHQVVVLERHKTLYNLPRVGIVHDDILRIFQEIGIIERIWPATQFLPTYELASHGKVLLSSDVASYATHGWPEYISIYQPAFERDLDAVAKSVPNIEVLQGREVVALSQDSEHVEVVTEDDAGVREVVQGRYLIGADGGNSFVRPALNVAYENLGFDQDWLVIDAKAKNPRPNLPLMRQLCEPEQPGVTLAMGPQHRRWSFMIFPGKSAEAAMRPKASGVGSIVRRGPRLMSTSSSASPPINSSRFTRSAGGLDKSFLPATPRIRCRHFWLKVCARDFATHTTLPGSLILYCKV